MPNTTIEQLKSAADDANLRARFETAATSLGLKLPDNQIKQIIWDNFGALVSTKVSGEEDKTIADVYAYAAENYKQALKDLPPAPGANPAAVTDTQIYDVLHQFFTKDTETQAG